MAIYKYTHSSFHTQIICSDVGGEILTCRKLSYFINKQYVLPAMIGCLMFLPYSVIEFMIVHSPLNFSHHSYVRANLYRGKPFLRTSMRRNFSRYLTRTAKHCCYRNDVSSSRQHAVVIFHLQNSNLNIHLCFQTAAKYNYR